VVDVVVPVVEPPVPPEPPLLDVLVVVPPPVPPEPPLLVLPPLPLEPEEDPQAVVAATRRTSKPVAIDFMKREFIRKLLLTRNSRRGASDAPTEGASVMMDSLSSANRASAREAALPGMGKNAPDAAFCVYR
jgi:hypothetical protein